MKTASDSDTTPPDRDYDVESFSRHSTASSFAESDQSNTAEVTSATAPNTDFHVESLCRRSTSCSFAEPGHVKTHPWVGVGLHPLTPCVKEGGSFLDCLARLVDAVVCGVFGSSASMAAITSSSSSSGLQNLSRAEPVATAAWFPGHLSRDGRWHWSGHPASSGLQ